MHAAYDVLRNPVCITDADLEAPGPRITYVNDAFVAATGFSREELIGHSPRVLQSPNSHRGELARLKRSLTLGMPYVGELMNRRKDGTEFAMEMTITPLRGDDTNVIGYVSVAHHDPRKQALLGVVRRANSEWVSILDALEDMVILEGYDQRIVRCNRAAAQFLGGNPQNVIGERLVERFWRASPPASERKARLQLRGSDDWYEHTAYALADGAGVVHLVSNVSDRRQLESIAEGINVSENLNFMVAGIRHELGNPLNSVKMALSVMRERLPTLGVADVVMYVDRMSAQVQRMEYLLQLLRSFSSNEVQRPEPTDLVSTIDEFIVLSQADFAQRGCRIVFERAFVPLVVGDPRALQQVLINLVANAADAKQGDREVTVTLRLARSGERVTLWVIDDGVGMTESQLQTLFRPFVTTKARGTGLGLSIVRRLLAPLSAGISATSELGRGTAFALSFVVATEVSI